MPIGAARAARQPAAYRWRLLCAAMPASSRWLPPWPVGLFAQVRPVRPSVYSCWYQSPWCAVRRARLGSAANGRTSLVVGPHPRLAPGLIARADAERPPADLKPVPAMRFVQIAGSSGPFCSPPAMQRARCLLTGPIPVGRPHRLNATSLPPLIALAAVSSRIDVLRVVRFRSSVFAQGHVRLRACRVRSHPGIGAGAPTAARTYFVRRGA
jgi:hypothetical protein